VTAAIACACLAGCAADTRSPSADPEPPREEGARVAVARDEAAPVAVARDEAARVVVTRDDTSSPAGCGPGAVARGIAAFFDAFNRGDPSAVGFVAPSGGWYSVTEGRRRHFVTYSRRGLRRYFARRHSRGERLRLEQVDVSHANGLGHIAYRIERRADDLRRLGNAGTTAIGKGAVDCASGRIVVWSMGMVPGDDPGAIFEVCPSPRTPSRAIVACARRRG
jgi:hypothetical protein